MAKQHYDIQKDLRYLQLLSHSFPTIAEASTEIINLQAILNLPKATEHFVADIHGEYEAFQHILKNASGNIKRKVNELFGTTLRDVEKRELCTLIYYPEQKLELVKASEPDINDWYHITLHHLVAVCRDVSSKYTRSKVRKSLPYDFSYIIQELLHERTEDSDKTAYVKVIIDTIISTGRADDFIIAISKVIQQLAIDQLHILGDIYDRGPGAHKIMDMLESYHSWDITWGNHDMLWMGAAAGNDACMCCVLRLSLRYANLTTLEEGYGINLVPLATFAMDTYGDDPCEEFIPKMSGGAEHLDDKTKLLIAREHKAIAVLQFKLEGQLYERHPEWKMQDRELFKAINYKKGTITIDGKEYKLTSCHFPTVDPNNPNALTAEEHDLIAKLHHSFEVSEKLHKHVRSLLAHGCMYGIYNNNLLYHASVPLNSDGSLKDVEIYPGHSSQGKQLMTDIGMLIRSAFQTDSPIKERQYAIDYFLYLWCGPDSPLFDKSKMATFERYFTAEKETHEEKKGSYFVLRDNEEVCDNILKAFGITGKNRHIINGHVPVKVRKGESPVKAGGRAIIIDGGFCRAYHKKTGISGYTLISNSRGLRLLEHQRIADVREALKANHDIESVSETIELQSCHNTVGDTDQGRVIQDEITDLYNLLLAYQNGLLKPQA